jgi:monofunctional biosynthetic peptidoglycan transglycosylase
MSRPVSRPRRGEGTGYFATALFLPILIYLFTPLEEVAMSESRMTTVFGFEEGAEPWRNIDDAVMGGVSRSTMTGGSGTALFEGVVSLENNGGFASVRSRPANHALAGFDGVVVRMKGDGKTYAVRLRTSAAFDGVSYQSLVDTVPGEWIERRLPFSAFRPVFRGRPVPGSQPLEPAEIRTFGLLISGEQEGPFRLELDWIRAYRD